MNMIKNWLARRQAKKFLKLIGATDLPTTNVEAQMLWASVCARAAWKSYTTGKTILPLAIEDDQMDAVIEQQWLSLMAPCRNIGFIPDDETDAFQMVFDRTEPKELIADPAVQQVLTRSYDLLEVVEENIYELPSDVASRAHKLRTAIQRHVSTTFGDETG